MQTTIMKIIAFDHETGVAVESLSTSAMYAKKYAISMMTFELIINGFLLPKSNVYMNREVEAVFDTPRFELRYSIERMEESEADLLMNEHAGNFSEKFCKAMEIVNKARGGNAQTNH